MKLKKLISLKRNKYPNGAGIYDLSGNLVKQFANNVEIGKHLNISRTTVGRYLNQGLIYNNMYLFKPLL